VSDEIAVSDVLGEIKKQAAADLTRAQRNARERMA
jgi:hypothetical protein